MTRTFVHLFALTTLLLRPGILSLAAVLLLAVAHLARQLVRP